MLPKINRLKKKKDFENIFKKGKIFRGDFLIVREVKNIFEEPRLGFVVSNKVSKSAVVRNKIRRRLRDIIKKNLGSFKKGTDVAIIALNGIEKKSFLEVKELTEAILKKSKLI